MMKDCRNLMVSCYTHRKHLDKAWDGSLVVVSRSDNLLLWLSVVPSGDMRRVCFAACSNYVKLPYEDSPCSPWKLLSKNNIHSDETQWRLAKYSKQGTQLLPVLSVLKRLRPGASSASSISLTQNRHASLCWHIYCDSSAQYATSNPTNKPQKIGVTL